MKKRSVEELLGIVLISILIVFIFMYYLTSSLKPEKTDFDWKKYHLEFIVQVFLNKEIYYSPGCFITVSQLINNMADSLSKLPSCYKEYVDQDTAKIINEIHLEETTKNFFNISKSPTETFLIVYKIGNYNKEINIPGEFNGKVFYYDECAKKSFIKSKLTLSSELSNLDGEVSFYYCKLII
jgi:PDZ domain-containing secreted protein